MRFKEVGDEAEAEAEAEAAAEAYGRRRNARFKMITTPISVPKDAVVIEDVVSFDKRVTLKAGERMV